MLLATGTLGSRCLRKGSLNTSYKCHPTNIQKPHLTSILRESECRGVNLWKVMKGNCLQASLGIHGHPLAISGALHDTLWSSLKDLAPQGGYALGMENGYTVYGFFVRWRFPVFVQWYTWYDIKKMTLVASEVWCVRILRFFVQGFKDIQVSRKHLPSTWSLKSWLRKTLRPCQPHRKVANVLITVNGEHPPDFIAWTNQFESSWSFCFNSCHSKVLFF